jgi:anti-sigma factor RsiW
MLPDRMILSAYIDGEVPARFVPDIESALRTNQQISAEYHELLGLRARLQSAPMPDVAESAGRSWVRLNRRLVGSGSPKIWNRAVRLPLPLAAAALTVLIGALCVLTWALLTRGPERADAQDYLAHGSNVDVTITVDSSDMENILEWLARQNMLGEVNIELPEQQFRIMGEPVMVKPADYGGDVTQ